MNEITSSFQRNVNKPITNKKPSSSHSTGSACPPKTSLADTLKNTSLNKLRGLLARALQGNRSLKRNAPASVRVYDIINCGPRRRFATAGLIVHNCLALGYSAGWFKFLSMAKLYVGDEAFDQIFKIKPSDEDTAKFLEYLGWLNSKKPNEFLKQWPILDEQTQWTWVQSWKQVTDFRAGNPKIIALWKKLGDGLAASVGGTYEIGLPSGRVLRYFNVAKSSDGFRVRTTRGGQFSRAYSGHLAENLSQAVARDVFANCMRNLENAGFPIVFTVHDEAILEVPEGTDPKVIEKIMAIPPTWMKSLPLGSEANVSKHYTK